LPRSHKILWLVVLGFIGITFYFPLARVLGLGFTGHLFVTDPNEISVWPVLFFTIWQALLSTLIAMLLGIPAAYIFYRRSFSGANILKSLITVPFMLPSLVVAMLVIELGRPFGGFAPIPAILLANVFANFPVVVRTVGAQWQNIADQTEEEAELSGSGRFSTALRIVLPQLSGSLRASAAIIFLYCTGSYGIVLSLGGGSVNTLETALSITVLERLDLSHGAAIALLQILLSVAAFTVSRWGGANPLNFDQQQSALRRIDKRDLPAFLYTISLTVLLVLTPLLLVLANAFIDSAGNFTLNNFLLLDSRGYRDLLNISMLEAASNSLRNLIVATFIAMVIGTLVSFLLAERGRKKKLKNSVSIFLDAVFLLPIGVSAVVIGLGYLISLSGSLSELRSQWFILPLVQSLFAIPLVIRIIYPALQTIDHVTREHAMTEGASAWSVFIRIDLGVIKSSLRTALVFAGLVSLGEFGSASLLAYSDQATVPVLLYQLISRPGNQNYNMALAVAAILTLITVLAVMSLDHRPKTIRKTRLKR